MRAASLKFLQTLINTPSPSGFETRGQRVWLDYARQFAEDFPQPLVVRCRDFNFIVFAISRALLAITAAQVLFRQLQVHSAPL